MKAGYGRLIVKPLEAQEESAGGIIMPRAADGLVRGTVVAVGPPDERFGGEEFFSEGDTVVFVEKTGKGKEEKTMAPPYIHGGESYLIVLQAEVRAVE